MPAFIDPTGKKFGRLTVTSYDGASVHGEARWRCERQ
jgi:hypothetical protein